MYKQDQVVVRRGAPHGSTLCYNCRNRLTYEVNTADHPLVTTASTPLGRARLEGPCALGHRTTSSQGAFGEAVWHQVPDGTKWKGARAGDTLCFACFQKMRPCKRPHETDAIEQDAESLVEQYFKRIKSPEIAARNDTDGAHSSTLKQPSGTDANTNDSDNANNDRSSLGRDPSDSPSASSSLIAISQKSHVPEKLLFNLDNKNHIEPSSLDTVAHNNCEISFSAKRSQRQARLVCGIFDSCQQENEFKHEVC